MENPQQSQIDSNRLRDHLVTVFVVACLLRSLCVFLVPKFPDEDALYLWASVFIHTQQGYGYWRTVPGNGLFWKSWVMPLYSYIQAVLMVFVGQNFFYMRFITVSVFILLGGLVCILVYGIAKLLRGNERFALVAAWIQALWPSQCLWSTRLHPHSLFNFWLVVFIFFILLGWKTGQTKWNVLSGFVLALMTLTRGEGVALWVPVAFWWFWQKSISRAGQTLGLFALAFFIGMAPWIIRNWNVHHRFMVTATNGIENLAFVNNPRYDPRDPFVGYVAFDDTLKEPLRPLHTETQAEDFYYRMATDYIKGHPRVFIRTTLMHLWHFWRPYLATRWVPWSWNILYMTTTVPILILFFIGLWHTRDPRTGWFLVGSFVVWKCLLHLPFYIVVRFRENVFPFILLIALLGLVRLFPRTSQKWNLQA